MRQAALGAAGAMALMAASAPALAAEEADDADVVTITAMRVEKPLEDVPATVTVIDSEEIADQLADDIKDLVRYEPGVSVRRSPARFTAALGATGRDGDSGFNIRGLEGNRVLIQEDGIRTPDAFSFGAQTVGRGDYADLDLLKTVEIVRGPASALYGSDGLAGAVTFITKDPADFLRGGRDVGLQGKVAYGSADEGFTEGLVAAGRQGRFSAMLAYTRRDFGETETKGSNNSANTDRTTANPQDFSSNALLGKLVFDPAEGQRLRLTVEHFDRDVDSQVLSARAKAPLGSTSTLDLIGRDTTDRDRVSLDYRLDSETGLFRTLKLAAWWQDAATEQYSAEDRNTAADRTRRNTFDNRVIGASTEAQSRFSLGGIEHRLVYGVDVSKTHQTGLRDGTIPPTGETFPTRAFPTTDYTLAGAFVQDEIAVMGGKLTFYPALRFDSYDLKPKADALLPGGLVPAGQSDSHVSPKLGVVVKPADGWTLFLNYASGFKAPAPSQVNNAFANLAFGYKSVPNPNLRPETSETVEAGVRWKNDRLQLSAVAFTGSYDDFIDQVVVSGAGTPADPAIYQYINRGEVKIVGAEATARADLGRGFTGQLALSYAHGQQRTGGVSTPLDSVEPVKLVTGLGWRQAEGRYGGQLTVTWSDAKPASRVSTATCAGCFVPPSFAVVDATAFWQVNGAVTLRGGVFNITDEKYWWWSDVRGVSAASTVRDAYTQPGRNAGVSLTLRY